MAYLLLGSSLVSGSNVFGSEIDLSLADYRFVGDGDLAGYSVAGAGDVDGDGLDDILVGAPTNDEGAYNAGAAYLILGSSLGTNPEIDLTVADYRFWGEYTQDRAGYSVSSAGDVDNDGLADILIGAPGMAPDADDWAGRAYIILGASLGMEAEIDLSLADHRLIGEHRLAKVLLQLAGRA